MAMPLSILPGIPKGFIFQLFRPTNPQHLPHWQYAKLENKPSVERATLLLLLPSTPSLPFLLFALFNTTSCTNRLKKQARKKLCHFLEESENMLESGIRELCWLDTNIPVVVAACEITLFCWLYTFYLIIVSLCSFQIRFARALSLSSSKRCTPTLLMTSIQVNSLASSAHFQCCAIPWFPVELLHVQLRLHCTLFKPAIFSHILRSRFYWNQCDLLAAFLFVLL